MGYFGKKKGKAEDFVEYTNCVICFFINNGISDFTKSEQYIRRVYEVAYIIEKSLDESITYNSALTPEEALSYCKIFSSFSNSEWKYIANRHRTDEDDSNRRKMVAISLCEHYIKFIKDNADTLSDFNGVDGNTQLEIIKCLKEEIRRIKVVKFASTSDCN